MERSFSTVQELNRYRKELSRRLASGTGALGSAGPVPA
jgi:hypothetical protein